VPPTIGIGQPHGIQIDEGEYEQGPEEESGDDRLHPHAVGDRGREPEEPESNSTAGYRVAIGSPHERHRARRRIHESTGMLSYQRTGASHAGQWDPGVLSDSPRGKRQMTTFAKLPSSRPKTASAAAKSSGSTVMRPLPDVMHESSGADGACRRYGAGNAREKGRQLALPALRSRSYCYRLILVVAVLIRGALGQTVRIR
jgi:hypothetical protein